MVGPLNVRDTIKPLPRDLEELVSNSGGHGFIIVSFGSQVASLPSREKVDMLATAFGKLKQLVVWRLKGILCFVRSLWLHKGHLRQQLMSYILILHVFYLQRAPMDVPLFFKISLWPLLFSNIQQILWKRKKSMWKVEKNPLFSPSYVSLTVKQRMGSFHDLRFTLRKVGRFMLLYRSKIPNLAEKLALRRFVCRWSHIARTWTFGKEVPKNKTEQKIMVM